MTRAGAPVRWPDGALAAPHRPMYVAAGLWALVVVGLTAWPGQAAPAAVPMGSLAGWHAHEMVFGFAAAAFAGYALTAMGSWSAAGRPARAGILALCAAWGLAGSPPGALSARIPAWSCPPVWPSWAS